MNTKQGPPITQLEFDGDDFPMAEKIAKQLGYTQTAYTSTSALWGMFCLPDRASQKSGCIIKTKEFGFLFVQDLEDLRMGGWITKKIWNYFSSSSSSLGS
jgi:hypothetical protein